MKTLTTQRLRRRKPLSMPFKVGVVMAALAAAMSPASIAQADPPPLDEGDVIYMILTDRFHNGDTGNDDFSYGNYDPNDLAMYHGGDWEGMADKMDYIEELGVSAIWLSSVSAGTPLPRRQ